MSDLLERLQAQSWIDDDLAGSRGDTFGTLGNALVKSGMTMIAYEKGARLCESPIEEHLLLFLITHSYPPITTSPVPVFAQGEEFPRDANMFIVPQMEASRYRVDFGIIAHWKGSSIIVAVECDGADFHDAARDAQRDAHLASFGIHTIRASGSDIYRKPRQVVQRLAWFLADWANRQ